MPFNTPTAGGGGAVGPAASTGFAGAVSVTASTTATQAGATQIPKGQYFTNVIGPSGNCYLTLPAGATLGDEYMVNSVVGLGAIAPQVFAPNSGKITYGGAAGSRYVCQTYGRAIFVSEGADNWNIAARVAGYSDNAGTFNDYTSSNVFFGQLSVQGGFSAGQGTYTAAGTNQATATAISSAILRVYVSSVAAGTGVILPFGYTHGVIINAGANSLLIYPDTNVFPNTINSLASGVGYSLAAGAAVMVMSAYTGTIYNYRLGVLA